MLIFRSRRVQYILLTFRHMLKVKGITYITKLQEKSFSSISSKSIFCNITPSFTKIPCYQIHILSYISMEESFGKFYIDEKPFRRFFDFVIPLTYFR